MTEKKIPRSLQHLVIVLVPSDCYAQNEEADWLFGKGLIFARKVGEFLGTSIPSDNNVRVVSFGADAFKQAATIITSNLESLWKDTNHPMIAFDPNLGSVKNMYVKILGQPCRQECDSVLEYLMDRRTDGADTVIFVTGRMAGINLIQSLCSVLDMKVPDLLHSQSDSAQIRSAGFSFKDQRVDLDLQW